MLHYITKKYDHFIGFKRSLWNSWTLFEPSKFIYAYFAFNSFYNFDWVKSIEEKKLVPLEREDDNLHEAIKCPECGQELEKKNNIGFKEKTKYKAMINFIFDGIEEHKIDANTIFLEIITNNGRLKENKIIEEISMITNDNHIEEHVREGFKKELEQILNTRKINKKHLREDIIYFIYMVRNNIFHGSKNTIEMSEDFQRKRLNIYSNIIIAINELLFKVLEQREVFKPEGIYRFPYES